jgi:aminoglycoside phosphotransferase (APT) family kinase protein
VNFSVKVEDPLAPTWNMTVVDPQLPWDTQLLSTLMDLGPVRTFTPIGRSAKTFFIEAEQGTLVAKRMEYVREPRAYTELFGRLSECADPPCPRFLRTVELSDYWYAVFRHVEGEVPNPADPTWDVVWRDAFTLLQRMRDLKDIVPAWDLNAWWLHRLSQVDFSYPPAQNLLRRLLDAPVEGPGTLAHGDFSAQNLLCTARGLVLVDWEEVGAAPIGFDAGWVLALNRVGSGPRLLPLEAFDNLVARGFPGMNLRWFESLGLLRLLYRAMTLSMGEITRALVMQRVRAAISDVGEGV